jgi:hypothetical protein
LLATGGFSLVFPAYKSWAEKRLGSARQTFSPALSARLDSDDPEWQPWVSARSRLERRALVEELDRRFQENEPVPNGAALLEALDLGVEELADLDRSRRIRTLVWLADVDAPIEPTELEAAISNHPDERAAVAALLLEHGHPDAHRFGTTLLLEGDRLSVFGLDTLYRLTEPSPSLLLTESRQRHDEWSSAKMAQIMQVLAVCRPVEHGSIEWALDALDDERPATRSAAHALALRYDADVEADRSALGHAPAARELISMPASITPERQRSTARLRREEADHE